MSDFLNSVWAVISDPSLRVWVGGVFCAIGGLSTVLAAIGVLRFPDFYTRLHAASVTDTLGALTLLFGMAIMAPDLLIVFKLGMIGFFLVVTSPTATHAIANAAFMAGLHPLVGRVDDLKVADTEKGEA